MQHEIIGILPHRYYSEVYSDPVEILDTDFMRRCALAHEEAGYDRVLIANSAIYPDSIPLATWVLANTTRLKTMIAHRPGFIAPTMAARMFAAMERTAPGRVGVHIITGSNDVEMRADGDYLTKDQRYLRSREYVEVMKRIWSEPEPFDHSGDCYRFEGAYGAVKPSRPDAIPVFWGGSSPGAIENGSAVADIYALAGGDRDAVVGKLDAMRRAAQGHGREVDFLLSTRVIIAGTQDEAWDIAAGHLEALLNEHAERGCLEQMPGESRSEVVQRRHAELFAESRSGLAFTGFAKVGIGRPIANCLVGTCDQIVGWLAELARAGVRRFILAGYDPDTYPAQFGETLLPQLRAAIAGAPVLEPERTPL